MVKSPSPFSGVNPGAPLGQPPVLATVHRGPDAVPSSRRSKAERQEPKQSKWWDSYSVPLALTRRGVFDIGPLPVSGSIQSCHSSTPSPFKGCSNTSSQRCQILLNLKSCSSMSFTTYHKFYAQFILTADSNPSVCNYYFINDVEV